MNCLPSAQRRARVFLLANVMMHVLSASLLPCKAQSSNLQMKREAVMGLCKGGETVLYNCPTKGDKFVSICAAGSEGVQYRFGTAKKVELLFPADPKDGRKSLLWSHYSRPLVDRWTVSFSTQDAEYSVVDWIDEENRRDMGVSVVLKASEKEIRIPCSRRPTLRRADIARLLTCDKESALGMGCK